MLFLYILAQENVQVCNNKDDDKINQSPASAYKEQWQTKLGSTMAYVLGNTDEVVEFDRARKNAEKHP